jgi:hypothetical protein
MLGYRELTSEKVSSLDNFGCFANVGEMKIKKVLGLIGIFIFLFVCGGCTTLPGTLGEKFRENNYGYTPLDPLPVIVHGMGDLKRGECGTNVLGALPDETMRLAVGQNTGQAGITYGPATIGYAGSNYIVILDYIKYNTLGFPITQTNSIINVQNAYRRQFLFIKFPPKIRTEKVERTFISYAETNADKVVPVYVGVGLRMTAHISVKNGSVNLGNLSALGVAAQAGQISGTMVIQTLGISGKTVSSGIPLPSEINTTTIQNALMALGTIKAKIYDSDVCVEPRALAIFNNIGGGPETVNSFISLLLKKKLTLDRAEHGVKLLAE